MLRKRLRIPSLPLIALGLTLAGAGPVLPCTTAVISAQATANGRPLLWKNRDADDRHNQVVYCADGRYAYIGLVNEGDAAGMQIWAGSNTAGFSIMNAASYNLEVDKDTKGEGAFMKLALQTCATLEDFQALLEKTNEGGRDVSANFGVIDARGGGSYFETGKHAYKRFNADDPLLAGSGYLVRTNFSESASLEEGTGFLRRDRAISLIELLVKSKKLTAESLLREVSRDQANVKIGSYPLTTTRKKSDPVTFAYTGDSICRFDTVSAVVFEGPAAGEPPSLTTAWVILGLPSGGVAVPLWAAAGEVPGEVAPSTEPAPLNAAFEEVRDLLYPDARGEQKKYVDVDSLGSPEYGVRLPLVAQEAANFKRVEGAAAAWRKQAPPAQEMAVLQASLASDTLKAVQSALEARRRNAPGTPKKKITPPGGQTGRVTVSDIKP
jgi:hypothetical protein